MPDDLAPLKEKPFNEMVSELERLMSHSNRAFLLGAGCSSCAGLPLTTQLMDRLIPESPLEQSAKAILTNLKMQFEGASNVTIEDYLSELVDLISVAERRNECGAKRTSISLGENSYDLSTLQNALEKIKAEIAKLLDPERVKVSSHQQFVRAVHGALTAGRPANSKPVDYFVLNYDTLVEDALALEGLRYTDGFCGGATAWWDQLCYGSDVVNARVFKIHGSIDWWQVEGDPLPRRIRPTIEQPDAPKKRLLIWPAATKYLETQNDPYAQMMEFMRKSLRPSSGSEMVLTICGYRFGDTHINLEIDHALRESERRLTLLIFTEMDEPTDQLLKWTNDVAIRDQVRIHAKRGFFHGDVALKSLTNLPWWKFEVLTRLLGGER